MKEEKDKDKKESEEEKNFCEESDILWEDYMEFLRYYIS